MGVECLVGVDRIPDLPCQPRDRRNVQSAYARSCLGALGRSVLDRDGRRVANSSISHSADAVAVAAATGASMGVGVDIEVPRPGLSAVRRVAMGPWDILELGSASSRLDLFVAWTAKEATLKALGVGLSIPMNSLALRLQGGALGVGECVVLDSDAAQGFGLSGESAVVECCIDDDSIVTAVALVEGSNALR